jgi:hypothetical protein
VLDAGAGGAAQRVGLDLVLVAEADDERALIFVAQEDGAAGAPSNSEAGTPARP